MLTLGTHKTYKITSLTADSYKQLFVLITMLLTVLSVQQSTFAMASPLPQQPSSSSVPSAQSIPSVLSSANNSNTNLLHSVRRQHHHNEHDRNQHRQHPKNNQFDFLLAENDHNNHQQLETDMEAEERLHKRHISWHDYYAKTMDSTNVEWYNPCGGQYVEVQTNPKVKSRPAIKKTLRILQNSTVRNYFALNVNHLYAIDIRNMSMWNKFDEDYKFLPNIKLKSRISLRRWYRQMQIFIASFDYLQRAQLHWDYNEGMQQSETSRELYTLRNNAREILCNIEIAINTTTGNTKTKSTIDSLFIPRQRMESLLHFYTNLQRISPLNWQHTKYDKSANYINPVDLRFAKSRYIRYVRRFIKLLRITTKRPGPIYLGRQSQQKNQNPNQRKIKKNPTNLE